MVDIETEQLLCKMVIIGLFSGLLAACVCDSIIKRFRGVSKDGKISRCPDSFRWHGRFWTL